MKAYERLLKYAVIKTLLMKPALQHLLPHASLTWPIL